MSKPKLVVVTGLSGAGRSTALAVLSDLGFQASDFVPQGLWPALLDQSKTDQLALGLPIKVAEAWPDLSQAWDVTVVYLSADTNSLLQRYSESRRIHPMDRGKGLADAIEHEREVARELLNRADQVIDTSDLKLAEFRQRVSDLVAPKARQPQIRLLSFSYRHGLPAEADMVFDLRWLKNPHYQPKLRPLTGRDQAVGDHIQTDADFPAFDRSLKDLIALMVERQAGEGKAYFTLAFGCTGGKHRSVFMAERIAAFLKARGEGVSCLHREHPGLKAD